MNLRRLGIAFGIWLALATTLAGCGGSGPDAGAPLDGRGGGIIAFSSERDGNMEIYVMNADGSGQRRLTDDPAQDCSPWLSPDGSRIAFSSNRDGNYELYVMGTDGANLTRLTRTDGNELNPVWTPDGERVVFASLPDIFAPGDIWIMVASGDNPRQLTSSLSDQIPYVTADGGEILFSRLSAGSYDIWVMKIDGTNARPLTSTGDEDLFARPSPDGRQIVFVRGATMSSPRNVYLMNPDGSDVRPLTLGPSVTEDPCWSPDGTRIVYQSDRGGDYDIYVMNSDGTDATNLTRHRGGDYWPSWAEASP